MKTKIAIDIDGVLAGFQEKFIYFHNAKYGTKTRLEDIITHRHSDVWGISEEEAVKRVLEFYNTLAFLQIDPVEGAVPGIEELSKDFDLFVITARPKSIEDKTNSFIDRYFPGKFKEIISTSSFSLSNRGIKKSNICLEKGIEIAVDDDYQNVWDCASNGIYSILLDDPWNKEHKISEENGIARAKNWKEIVKLAREYSF